LGTIGALASISGYSQDFETEADTEGLALMVAAGYDPAEAVKLFVHLKQDVEDDKQKEPFFFGSHPRLEERIANYERLVSAYPAARGKTNADQFSNKIRPLILENTRLNIAMGRFRAAEKDLQKAMERYGESADFRFVLGEVYAQRAAPLDAEKAQKEYQRALEIDPRYAAGYKALALLHYKQGNGPRAKTAFEQYLQFSPSPEDRAYIEGYLGTLAGEKGASQ
jgi:beta-barrel assembly-enhancing protease